MTVKTKDPWTTAVKNYLKSEIVKRDLSYADLVPLLADIGIEETENSIRNKLSRGTFPATFFFQVLTAIGVENEIKKLAQDIRAV